VDEAATIATVIAPLRIPARLVHLVLVNGLYVPPAERGARRFRDGDVVAIWPPIAGG
jgi:sulfur carrier protein ThiS